MAQLLDLRGLRCPLVLVSARQALAALPAGEALVVLATDPEAPIDLAALAADAGRVFGESRDGDAWRLVLEPRFAAAAAAIEAGDLAALRALLDADPGLTRARSPAAHHATLLHHVAVNGIDLTREIPSTPNAVEVARLLLERGSEPDALCDTYGGGPAQTTLCLLVSSAPPAKAGVQAGLVEALCAAGARSDGVEDDGLPLWTAIAFSYTAAAEALARSGARVDNAVFAAALGDLRGVERELAAPRAPGFGLDAERILEYALIYAAAHGRHAVVESLLKRDPDLSVTEPMWGATAPGIARYHGHDAIVALLGG